jgi:integrase
MALSDSKLKGMLKGHSDTKPRKVTDGEGLSVLWRASGKVSFVFRYRIAGKAKNVSLGEYNGQETGLTLKNARVKAQQCKGWLNEGHDPAIQLKIVKDERLRPLTVSDALDYWLVKYADEKRVNAAKHKQQFEKWIIPHIGRLPINGISKHHWIDCFEIRSKKYPVAAGYVLRNVQQALKFCIKRGFEVNRDIFELDHEAIGASKQAKRSRRLVDDSSWDEFTQVVKWIDQGKIQPYYRNLLTLLISFGCRTQELRLSKVGEWDLDRMLWIVPPEHNKTRIKDQAKGQSGEIMRPIPAGLKPFIESLIDSTSTEYLLGQLKQSPAVSAWGGQIWKLLEHKNKWRLHDLRRTFATGLNDLGVAPHIVESLLGHSIQGVAGIYNHSQYLPEKLKALELWQDRLALLRGDTANVVMLGRAS